MWSTRANRNYGPPDGIQPESLIWLRSEEVRLESLTYFGSRVIGSTCNCIDGSQAVLQGNAMLQTKRVVSRSTRPGARRYNIILAQERRLGNYFVAGGGSKRCAARERRRGSKRCASGASGVRIALVVRARMAYKSRPLRARFGWLDALLSRLDSPRSRSPCLRTIPLASAAKNAVDDAVDSGHS